MFKKGLLYLVNRNTLIYCTKTDKFYQVKCTYHPRENMKVLYIDEQCSLTKTFNYVFIVLIVDLSLYLKTKKLLSVFPLFMTNMLSFLRTRLPTISCLYVNHITSNA